MAGHRERGRAGPARDIVERVSRVVLWAVSAALLLAAVTPWAGGPAAEGPPAPSGTARAPVAPPGAAAPVVAPASAITAGPRSEAGTAAAGEGAAPTAPEGTGAAPGTPSSGAAAGPAPGADYAWPLSPVPQVARPFEAPPFRYGRGHRGADLAGVPGQPVFAARDGRVVFAGVLAGRGVVSVEHADGLRTTYEPVAAAVAPGQEVGRGTVLGTLEPGHPGCPTACLHWGLRRGSGAAAEYLDPLVLLGPRHVRLLPLPDPWPL